MSTRIATYMRQNVLSHGFIGTPNPRRARAVRSAVGLTLTAGILVLGAGDAVALSGGSLISSNASFSANVNDLAGTSLSGAGDVNGDGSTIW